MDKREITKVEYGAENANAVVLEFMSNAAEHIHSCVETKGAQVGVEQFKQASSEAKKRGIALKCITEINRENLEYCREILQTAELRHFAGIRGNFAVSESEYMPPAHCLGRTLLWRRSSIATWKNSSCSNSRFSTPCGCVPYLPT